MGLSSYVRPNFRKALRNKIAMKCIVDLSFIHVVGTMPIQHELQAIALQEGVTWVDGTTDIFPHIYHALLFTFNPDNGTYCMALGFSNHAVKHPYPVYNADTDSFTPDIFAPKAKVDVSISLGEIRQFYPYEQMLYVLKKFGYNVRPNCIVKFDDKGIVCSMLLPTFLKELALEKVYVKKYGDLTKFSDVLLSMVNSNSGSKPFWFSSKLLIPRENERFNQCVKHQ